MPGLAVRDAPGEAGGFPLVILSHGFGGATAGMSWLAENLASLPVERDFISRRLIEIGDKGMTDQ